MNFNSSVLSLVFVFFYFSLSAQQSKPVATKVEKTFAVKLGKTPPIKELESRPFKAAAKKRYYKNKTVPPRNFNGRYESRLIEQLDHASGPDRLRQTNTTKNRGIEIEPIFNFEGLNDGRSPHDPTGDVGKDYYLQGVNLTNIAVYDKNTGELVSQFSANTLWGSVGFNSGGDPIILYDQEYERWIITEFPSGFGSNFNQLLVAVSETSDPLGSYYAYNFNTPSFPDYPKYAIWPNALCVTTNEQGPGVLHGYFLNREELMTAADMVTIQRVSFPGNQQTEAGFFVASPVDWTGRNAPPSDRGPMILALNDASWNVDQEEDRLEIFSLELDWDDENNTSWNQYSLDVSPYDSYPCASTGFGFACIPQLNGNGLDGIPETIMHQVHYRNFGTHEAMVLNFITDVTDGQNLSGIRWMELRRTAQDNWTVYQEGSYAPDDGLHRFMGGTAMDGSGNIGLAYNVSSESTYAGVRFTGRRAGDPLGEMTVDEYQVIEGQSAINDGTRFGDYAHMVVDPVNDRTFWYTTEYAGPTGSRTRVIAYELTRDSFDIAPTALKNPLSGAMLTDMEAVEASVRNFGINTVDSFEISYELDGAFVVTDKVLFNLAADSVYDHQFSIPADLSGLGMHELKIYTSLEEDKSVFNDTVRITINHVPQLDVAVSNITNVNELVCGTSTSLNVVLNNPGFDTLHTFELSLLVNGDPAGNFNYDQVIESGGSTTVGVPVDGLLDGENNIVIDVVSVNGEMDPLDSNNRIEAVISAVENGFEGLLRILFDDYPDETSWTLETDSGETIAAGGPYESEMAQEILEIPVCLDPDNCYRFTINDSYGDGISFGGVTGDYSIFDDQGNVLASLMNALFGDSEINEFCAQFECMVEIDAQSSPSGISMANDGVIMVEVLNGVGPFNYSIDGGQTVQSSNVFTDLAAGRYTVLVTGANGCTDEIEVDVLECMLSVMIELTAETDSATMDGMINIVAEGAFGDLSYSVDGGSSFMDSGNFEGLSFGEYDVVVHDSLGCNYTEMVRLSNLTSTQNQILGAAVKIYPNPTDGVFRIELEGLNGAEHYINARLFDINGQLLQRTQLARYDSSHVGIMSLYHYPAGSYLLQIESEETRRLFSIIKE